MSNQHDLIDTTGRESEVIALRRTGMTFEEIARQVGYKNASGAWQAMRRGLKKTLTDAGSDELRQIEADRLDALQESMWALAMTGDLRAADVILRVMQRRARLLGLDAPIKQEITTYEGGTDIDREVQRLVSLLDAGSSVPVDMADDVSAD